MPCGVSGFGSLARPERPCSRPLGSTHWSRYRSPDPRAEGVLTHNPTEPSSTPDPAASEPRRRGRLHGRLHANPALSLTTKLVVTTLGTLVIVAGLVMMVTPGPGIVAIAVGLGILATEYDWAERWLHKARDKAHQARLRAEAMDPRVRRRRLLMTGAGLVLVVGAVVLYVSVYGWPTFAVTGWDWLQGVFRWAPELPGM